MRQSTQVVYSELIDPMDALTSLHTSEMASFNQIYSHLVGYLLWTDFIFRNSVISWQTSCEPKSKPYRSPQKSIRFRPTRSSTRPSQTINVERSQSRREARSPLPPRTAIRRHAVVDFGSSRLGPKLKILNLATTGQVRCRTRFHYNGA
jgi:hypothetical protein